MGVKLTIEVEPPVTPEDAEILSGSVMVLLALGGKIQQTEDEPQTDGVDEMQDKVTEALGNLGEEPERCGHVDPRTDPRLPVRVCVSDPGHAGRHLYRRVPAVN